MITPWSTEVDVVTPAGSDEKQVRVGLYLTTDPGPARTFRHFLDFDLDEAHATEMLGKLTLALRNLRATNARHQDLREAVS